MAVMRNSKAPSASAPVTHVKGHRLIAPHRELTSTLQLRQVESDARSVTVQSGIIMPRPAPRLELANALSQARYTDVMVLEIVNLQVQVQTLLLLYSRKKHTRARVGSISSNRRSSRRSLGINLQFLYALMAYNRKMQYFNRRTGLIFSLSAERYIRTQLPLPKTFTWLQQILPNSPEYIFESHTRMTRRSFSMLLDILQTKAKRFFNGRRGRRHLPLSIQLHLAPFALGFYGDGANFESARAKFGYSVGSILNCRRRVVNAITSLAGEYIKWPDALERRQLCQEVKEKYGFHSAFFAVDGTTHPFAFVPSYQRNSWFDRKSRYSIQALVTNDINLRVRHLVVGWPGSTHDARVLGSSDLMLERNDSEYFDGEQHGLGDTAVGLHKRVVPNYKEPLASIPENTEYNRLHSSFRVKSEHTIGHVKNRFQGLKEVRLRLRNKTEVLEIVSTSQPDMRFTTCSSNLRTTIKPPQTPWTRKNKNWQ